MTETGAVKGIKVKAWAVKGVRVVSGFDGERYFCRLGEQIPQRFDTQTERNQALADALGLDELPDWVMED